MKDKKFLIVFIVILLIIVGLFVIVVTNNDHLDVNFFGNDDNNKGNNSSSTISTTYELLTNRDIFFEINSYINNFYDYVEKENSSSVLDLLSIDYINKNNINQNNVLNVINQKYQNLDFYSNQIYFKTKGDITYYFVKGELEQYLFVTESSTMKDNYIIVIKDEKNKSFSIRPLETISDFEKFIKTYDDELTKISQNNLNKTSKVSIDDERLIKYYINYYRNILFLNTKKAYQMLSSQMISKYPNINDFTNNINYIYNLMSSNILGYNIIDKTFSAQMNNLNYIDIKEESIMNFKVTITEFK